MMRLAMAGLFLSCVLPSGAKAEPILYTESVTGSGSLGGATFSDAQIVVSVLADTSNVQFNGIVYVNQAVSASVSIQGLGTYSITDATTVSDSTNFMSPAAGISIRYYQNNTIYHLDTQDAAFISYDLTTSIGPISGPDAGGLLKAGTTNGDFIMTSVEPNSAFQATLLAVPEPSSFVLLGLAAIMLPISTRLARVRAARSR